MRAAMIPITALIFTSQLIAQSTVGSAANAWPLYDKAAQRIREGDKLGKSSPTASGLPGIVGLYPPFSKLWENVAKDAYEFNASALEAVHQATALKVAHWPVTHRGNDVQLAYLGEMRNVAIEIGDAGMYEHVHGKDIAAIDRMQDLFPIADLLDEPKDEMIVQAMVAAGIRQIAHARLQVIATELRLTSDAQKDDAGELVPVETVRALIKQLFTLDDPDERMKDLIDHEHALAKPFETEREYFERAKLQLRRGQMERNLTAMSLACQVIRFEKGHWPASLEEALIELPAVPTDAWGPQRYVMIKNGRPDGSHRPVVYSRHGAGERGMLFYPTGGPAFGYYNSGRFGAKDIPVEGQFRDVSLWDGGNQPAGLKQLK